MGTSMDMYAERRSHRQWQFIGRMVKNESYEDDPDYEMPYQPELLYGSRNYSLFAILADVGNGILEEKYEYIAPLRGLPDDLSPELKTWFESSQNKEEVHASWLTLEELITFDWHGKSRKKYAVVDERVAYLFHPERSFPFREWPQGIRIGYSITLKEACNASWTETYAEAAGPDFLELLDIFAKKYGVSNNVRFIFSFSW
jgi:hypothetical protein